MDSIKKQSSKIVATLFGSDFYRVARKKGEHKKIFETAKIITIGPNMKRGLFSYYPEFVDKIKFAHFGSARLDIISELYNEKNDKFIEINIKSKKIKL